MVNRLFELCPAPPDWRLDWRAMDREFAFVSRLAGCEQDAIHHAEGDVWIHTRMVCERLAADQEWRGLAERDRQVVFAAALLHDVAKPDCTRHDDGRITARGHSRRGAIMAREILWRMNVPFRQREQVAALIRFHQAPFFLVEKSDSQRHAIEISQTARGDWLALVAKADALGRVCNDGQRLLDNIALFVEYLREQRCLDRSWQFASDHSRFLYFHKADRDPDYAAYDDTRLEVILMSGLPGAGKDSWVSERLAGWPVVSLDELRREMKIAPTGKQGRVITAARERAREHLRAGRSFVWNATNISRQLRAQSVDLFAAYNARIRIVYVETAAAQLYQQNREREGAVPGAVIDRLIEQWEVPDLTEAHQVNWNIW